MPGKGSNLCIRIIWGSVLKCKVAEPSHGNSDSAGEAWNLQFNTISRGSKLQNFGMSAYKAYGLPAAGCHWTGGRALGSSPQWLVTLWNWLPCSGSQFP